MVLPLRPQSGGPLRLELVADYFEGQIDLKAFRARYPHHTVLSANPLVLESEQGSYAYLEKFGVVVFWNCSEGLIRSLHQELEALGTLGSRVEQVRDILTARKNHRLEWIIIGLIAVEIVFFLIEKLPLLRK